MRYANRKAIKRTIILRLGADANSGLFESYIITIRVCSIPTIVASTLRIILVKRFAIFINDCCLLIGIMEI